MKAFLLLLTDKRFLFVYFFLVVLTITLQQYLLNKYGNYIIFKNAHLHLMFGMDLYKLYPETKQDFYKYSPTFAYFFGLFRLFPGFSGLFVWNLLNSFLLFAGINSLPGLNNRSKGFILVAITIEMITSISNSQSNGLVAGLLIMGFALFENNRFFLGTFCIVGTVFIKIFGLAALVLLLFYPEKWKIIFYSVFWGLIMLILPMALISPHYLAACFMGWFGILASDYSQSAGLSIMGLLQTWSGMEVNKNIILLIGLFFLLLPLLVCRKNFDLPFRLKYVASLLIWIVIFNHKAESPTYIIAMTGIALWFFSSEKKITDRIFFILSIVLVSLTPTNLFPENFRDDFLQHYCIKALPAILIWIKITIDLLTNSRKSNSLFISHHDKMLK